MAKLTPMMEQYKEIKEKFKHCMLFFRLGDFYELFYDDAIVAAKELDITLTGKDCGQEERAPMCGVPFHSAEGYITRLVEKGYYVAICEQLEEPKQAKGIVKRDVVRIVTPGTVTDSVALDEKKNNYILCIFSNKLGYGISFCDVTTGEFQTTEFISVNAAKKISDEINRLAPAEILCNTFLKEQKEFEQFEKRYNLKIVVCDDWQFEYTTAKKKICQHFNVHNIEGFGLRDKNHACCASGALLEYLYDTQKISLSHIFSLKYYSLNDYMNLDVATVRNLELVETMRDKEKKGTLLWVLDKTKTAMGARLLRNWVLRPLIQKDSIQKRIDSVEELGAQIFLREEIKNVLNSMQDFERIMSKIIYKSANCRDLISLKNSIENLPLLKQIIRKCKSIYLVSLFEALDTLDNIYALIDKAIVDEPPFTVREGGMIKYGYNNGLDILLNAKNEGARWIEELEAKEKEATGIKNLKIRYNRIFGYYIEVTKSNLSDVPDRYIRKQTLANCERYITPQLSDLAELILGSEAKIVNLEYELFTAIREAIARDVKRIQYSAQVVAVIDVLQSMAEVAQQQNYVKPKLSIDGVIDIKNGRHPVVEKIIEMPFVPNETYLDNNDSRLSIITGPNMAGKSTYMRQTALIVLLAQIGSFVPASNASISVVDRIFTRVGASDDLSTGQSTFMVEMTEVANILNNATQNSLLILDEIGRGTSTFDGLSIAWAVLEFITDQKQIGAKTLFATHYHELTELEGKLNGVVNYCISVKEQGEDIIFLRKIIRGGADNSYGVQVAKLAGLPNKVIKRSSEILKQLNAADITKKAKKIAAQSKEQSEAVTTQVDMFSMNEMQLIHEIRVLDVMAMTPLEALQQLFDLQNKVKGM